MALFQVKPEQPSKKADKTQINLTKVTAKGNLPRQEKQPFLDQKKNQATINLQKNEPYINEKKTQYLENLHFIVNAIRSMFLD